MLLLYVGYDVYHVSVLQICIVGQQLLHHLNMALLGGGNQCSPAILGTRQKGTVIGSLSKCKILLFLNLTEFERFRTYQLVIPSSHECLNAMDNNAQ